jgi:chorismate mutase
MSDPDPEPSALTLLRARIDTVDHELLRTLARRMQIVEEISAWKRSHAAQIRDVPRERELLDDRRALAATLGLEPEAVEAIFTLVLRAARELQAKLRAEQP